MKDKNPPSGQNLSGVASKLAIAIDLGASNVRVALVSSGGEIAHKLKEPTKKEGKTGEVVSEQVVRLAEQVASKIDAASLCGIGVSSIGPLDHRQGGPLHSPNVPFDFIPLVAPLKSTFSLPVFLLNDCNAAVLAEKHFGQGKNTKNLFYITLSTGIGGGAIVDDKLLFGKGGNAAEVGHFVVDTKYDLLCSCKKGYGHWEGLASGTNIPRFFRYWAESEKRTVDFEPSEAKDIFEVAKKGNVHAIAFLDELAKVNAHALSNIIVAYDPELITIGGSVALQNPDVILEGILKHVDHYLADPYITITDLGEDITLLGAAAGAFGEGRG